MTQQKISIYIISDSAGETASTLANAVMAQYPDANIGLFKNIFINEEYDLISTLEAAKEHNAIVIHTLISKKLVKIANNFCEQNNLFYMDMLTPIVDELANRSDVRPNRVPGAVHLLNKQYFNRIDAMEFAVQCDDGKYAKGLLEADIVLLGVSRTSKTPLSLFLANKNFKVANLPLIPQSPVPKELWEVDPKKIVGLTNDPNVLNKIRKERMISYGLNPETAYSNIEQINLELEYATNLYDKLGCVVINVADRAIEETASLITHLLELDNDSFYG